MTLDCQGARERLADYAANDLDAAAAGEIAAHLAACPACRAQYERAAAIIRAAERLDTPPLPAAFADGVMVRIDGAHLRTNRLRPWAWSAAAAAAAAILAVALWPVLRPAGTSPPGPAPPPAGLSDLVDGLEGTVRSAGGAGEERLSAVLSAGEEMLTASAAAPEAPGGKADELVALVREGTVGIDEDLEDMTREVTDAVSEALRCIPWI